MSNELSCQRNQARESPGTKPRPLSTGYHRQINMLQVHVLSLLASLAAAQSGLLNGLDQALSARQDVSTFYGLLSRYPQVLLDLPIYTGVTFIAPNNDAFEKDKKWDPDDEAVVTDTLRYHVLQ